VDLRQMKAAQKLPTEKKPDGSANAGPFRKPYVSDERGKADAIVARMVVYEALTRP
jgi:hypothetical protein